MTLSRKQHTIVDAHDLVDAEAVSERADTAMLPQLRSCLLFASEQACLVQCTWINGRTKNSLLYIWQLPSRMDHA